MPNETNSSTNKRQFVNAVFIPMIIGIFIVLSFIMEKGMDWDFHTAGIYPRRFENIWGVLTLVFVHANLEHLANNLISFLLLSSFLYYFYAQLASKIIFISYIASGLILWLIGRDSWHIGASGLIYSLAFFLFFSGIFRKHIPLIAISLTVAFVYGSMIWHIFPWQIQDPISWEGHLAGGITGIGLAFLYRNDEPQRPEKKWDEEDDSDVDESTDYLQDQEDLDDTDFK
jgi:membrane associated rhomboid family serine protease